MWSIYIIFFFLYFNFVYGIIFPLSLETRSWQLNLSFLWSYYRVEVHMGRVRAFALLFTRTWSSTLVYFPPKQQLSSIVCFFTATSTAAGAFHKFLILQQNWHLLKLNEECYGYLTRKPGSNWLLSDLLDESERETMKLSYIKMLKGCWRRNKLTR